MFACSNAANSSLSRAQSTDTAAPPSPASINGPSNPNRARHHRPNSQALHRNGSYDTARFACPARMPDHHALLSTRCPRGVPLTVRFGRRPPQTGGGKRLVPRRGQPRRDRLPTAGARARRRGLRSGCAQIEHLVRMLEAQRVQRIRTTGREPSAPHEAPSLPRYRFGHRTAPVCLARRGSVIELKRLCGLGQSARSRAVALSR
jgi:hypothetical protein